MIITESNYHKCGENQCKVHKFVNVFDLERNDFLSPLLIIKSNMFLLSDQCGCRQSEEVKAEEEKRGGGGGGGIGGGERRGGGGGRGREGGGGAGPDRVGSHREGRARRGAAHPEVSAASRTEKVPVRVGARLQHQTATARKHAQKVAEVNFPDRHKLRGFFCPSPQRANPSLLIDSLLLGGLKKFCRRCGVHVSARGFSFFFPTSRLIESELKSLG